MSTTAIRDGDHYVVNGAKTFITNGINADLVIAAVKTDPTQRHAGMSLLVVERGMDGFERGRNLEKVGLHAQDTAELFFTDVQVPVENLLGVEGKGFAHLVDNLPQERLSIAVSGVAAAEAALGWTLDYVQERTAFGSPIASFQNTRFALAEMRTEVDIATVFVDRCVEALNLGELTVEEAAEAKWWCTELQKRTVDRCVQLHGGYGYMLEYPIARAYVDRARDDHLRRYDRDHERDHRSQADEGMIVDDTDARINGWIRDHIGGTVVAMRRQARWRPVWFVDVDRDGERLEIMVRGDRTDAAPLFPLEHEMKFQQLLEEDGIPVPHVYGWSDEPRAFVTDAVPGAAHFERATEAERVAVMDEYMGILARIHALDPDRYARAGIVRAATPARSGTVGMDVYEDGYRRTKVRPDPFLEFCLGWLARNPVDTHGREAPVVWDSGQFHQQDGHIVAVLDLELGHVGDPMMDLAAFRMRDTVLGFGDMNVLYDQYAKHRGAPVDIPAIMHHHFAFTLSNQLAFHAALAAPPAASDYMTNMQWASETNLFALEALAEILGVEELDAVETPAPRESPVARAHEHLVRSLRSLELTDEYERHQLRIAFRLARHLQRFDEIGDALTAADLDDLHALLGRRPATWQEGDAALEAFVLADDGAHDVELLQLFHRRYLRYKLLTGPAGSAMATHHPIQQFSRSSHTVHTSS